MAASVVFPYPLFYSKGLLAVKVMMWVMGGREEKQTSMRDFLV